MRAKHCGRRLSGDQTDPGFCAARSPGMTSVVGKRGGRGMSEKKCGDRGWRFAGFVTPGPAGGRDTESVWVRIAIDPGSTRHTPATCHTLDMGHHANTHDELFDRLAALLSAQGGVEFASVFGSVANGLARADSDIDVAVLTDAPLRSERRQRLIGALADVAGRPVDLVDLRDAGPVVLMSALRGRRLIGRGGATNAALLSRAWTDAADFLPLREGILKQRRAAWTS